MEFTKNNPSDRFLISREGYKISASKIKDGWLYGVFTPQSNANLYKPPIRAGDYHSAIEITNDLDQAKRAANDHFTRLSRETNKRNAI